MYIDRQINTIPAYIRYGSSARSCWSRCSEEIPVLVGELFVETADLARKSLSEELMVTEAF
jgi:hypothetical protein